MDQYGSVKVDQWTSPTDPANPRGDALPEETRQSDPANPRGDAVPEETRQSDPANPRGDAVPEDMRQLVGGGYKLDG